MCQNRSNLKTFEMHRFCNLFVCLAVRVQIQDLIYEVIGNL